MLSEKQYLFKDYLIQRLGFVKDDFLSSYLYRLEQSTNRYRYLGALPDIFEDIKDEDGNISRQIKRITKFKDYKWKHGVYVPEQFGIIDFLNEEYKIKQEKKVEEKKNSASFISATDIANFTYCPVSFAISKTFSLIKLESAHIGTELHEEKQLMAFLSENKSYNFDDEKTKPIFVNSANEYFFKEIFASKNVYNGHNLENKKKYFKSLKGNFVGQPDYIFKNSQGVHYVVEEKFQFEVLSDGVETSSVKPNFHSNHVNQLLSYLYGISEYNIEYGYLIYWKFSLDWGKPFTHSCHVYKVSKSEITRTQLIEVYTSLKGFLASKVLKFDVSKRNPKKCANCVSNLICGHKTGRFNTVTFPYSQHYMRTYYAEFPKELKKDYKPDDNEGSKD